MANPTSAFGWQMPTNTDLVKDLPADFEVFGQAVDTDLADLKGGTTGQILSKTSNTDMDFTWVTPATPVSGLTLVKSQTIGTTVASVTVTDAFSSTYDNYYISITGGVASAMNRLNLTLGATSTGYYRFYIYGQYNGVTVNGENASNAASFSDVVIGSTDSLTGHFHLFAPNQAAHTRINFVNAGGNVSYPQDGNMFVGGGFLNNQTQYTAFTLTASTGTISGGTIRVYGYQNS